MARINALANEFLAGNFNPGIYFTVAFDCGYPLGIFYPDIFLYPFAALTALGLSPYYSLVLFLICIDIATMLSAYFCTNKIVNDIRTSNTVANSQINNAAYVSFICTSLYIMFPYRLFDLHLRMAVGESLLFVFIPVICLGIYKIFSKKKFSVALAFGMIGIAHAHILSIAMMCLALCFFYLVNIKKILKNVKIVIFTAINAVITVLCSLDVILPIWEMQNAVDLHYSSGESRFGTLSNNALGFANIYIGAVSTVVLAIACIYFVAKKKATLDMSMCFCAVASLVLSTNLFCWNLLEKYIPFFNVIQFPTRFLSFLSIPFVYYVCMWMIQEKATAKSSILKKAFLCIIYIEFLICIVLPHVIESSDQLDLILYERGSVGGDGDYLSSEMYNSIMSKNTIPDTGYETERNGNTFTFVPDDNGVTLPLFYYPGYTLTDDNGNTYTYTNKNGYIHIDNITATNITAKYSGTKVQITSNLIAGISFLLLVAISVIWRLYFYLLHLNSTNTPIII
ncbi:MAG: hypothetical protein ACI4DS_05485 [Eubacterium sp.]